MSNYNILYYTTSLEAFFNKNLDYSFYEQLNMQTMFICEWHGVLKIHAIDVIFLMNYKIKNWIEIFIESIIF